jgi:hypothetical protein
MLNDDEKQSILNKSYELVHVMSNIATLLNKRDIGEEISKTFYEYGNRKRNDGFQFCVDLNVNLSDAQRKLTPYANIFAHPPPKKTGNSHEG